MKNSFGKEFQQFALSVDIVDKKIMEFIEKLLDSYFKDKLDVLFYELLIECDCDQADKEKGLMTAWGSYEGGKFANLYKTIDDGKKVFRGQTAYCFYYGKPMWVVSSEKNNSLTESRSYLDLWSNSKDIPAYWHYDKNPITPRTSILLPLRDFKNKVNGVLNLESEKYLEINDFIKDELTVICKSLTIIRELHNNNEFRRERTGEALNRLRTIAELDKLDNRLRKPSLFIASPCTADEELMGLIVEIANKYSEKVEIINWKNIKDSGSIHIQILEAIKNASFGICYFSERVSGSSCDKNVYKDNPNVLFEAGMLHALTSDDLATPSAWIPIREETTETVPFDLSSERILVVPRENGVLNCDKFGGELKKRIKNIL